MSNKYEFILDVAGLKFPAPRARTDRTVLFSNPLSPFSVGQILRRGNFWFRVVETFLPGVHVVRRYYPNRLPQ